MVYNSKCVLVTGGAGFIGMHLVSNLLSLGYKVNTTTRDLESDYMLPLKLLQKNYKGKLNIFEADLLVQGSFEAAMENVEAVFHVATPVLVGKVNDNPDEQIKPAVEGTLDILNSCVKFPKLKTIIITSSCLTTRDFSLDKESFNESDFNYTIGSETEPYIRAKTLAERVVWDFYAIYKNRFRIITLHPTIVLGPNYQIEGAMSSRSNIGKDMVFSIIKDINVDLLPDSFGVVDVRDVAMAHIKALECSKADGRFLIYAQSLPKKSIINTAYKFFPGMKKNYTFKENKILKPVVYDNTKSKRILGMQYRSIEETLRDTLIQIKTEFSM